MQFRTIALKLFIILSLLFPVALSHAEDTVTASPAPETTTEQLVNISTEIQDLKAKIASLKKEIKSETDENHKKELEDSVKRANDQLKEYSELFEKISLGGIDISRFEIPAKQAIQQVEDYNWQKELIQIAQPVFTELKKVTDVPRKRDLLRLEQKEIDDRLNQLNKGLVSLNAIDTKDLSPTAQQSLKEIKNTWDSLNKELERERNLTNIKLDELTVKEGFVSRLKNGAWEFAKGRGLVLVITITTVSVLLYLFNNFLIFLESREKNKVSIRWRIFMLLYQIVTTLIIVTVTLSILYSSGDMVLFGIAILLILAFLVTSRNSIPKYYIKTRIFLNMGQAREGERVIYNDLPWKVSRINLHTAQLVNPLLENGTVRLTIDHLNSMISRPIKMEEAWFPTVTNDVVLLPNGLTYKVQRQTPEYVYLISSGTEVIYPSKDFIKDKIVNLTYGYSVSTEFFLGYASVQNKLEKVIATLQEDLTAFLQKENPSAFKSIKSLSVDFSRINEGGNAIFMVSVTMGSNATDYRGSIIRTLQRGCMAIAESNQWKIV